MYGYSSKILRVDVSNKRVNEKRLKNSVCEKIIGGVGFGAYVLYNEVSNETSPLGAENKVIFSTGPFQATNLPGSAKWVAITKSPMSSFYSDSAAGSDFGIQLKKAGYDAMVIEGKADRPIFLEIENENIEFCDAKEIWGKDTYETDAVLKKDYSKEDFSIAAIGQGGENLVKFASVIVDKHSALGRCGIGAVLGSKKLKAICIKGNKEIEVANEDKVKELRRELTKKISKTTTTLKRHGTPSYMSIGEGFGDVPIKNWRVGSWKEGNKKLGAPIYTDTILKGRLACPNCPIGCHRYIKVDSPKKYKMEGAGPEYETLAMIGENCLIDSLSAVAKANDLCNRYGIDTISTGASIAFLMECFEKGFINETSTDGLDLTWGNADSVIQLIKKIVFREGFGNILAEGIRYAAEKINPKTKELAVEVKGIGLPAHDPRAFFAVALNYATGVRGPGHERGNLQIPYQGILLPELGINKKPQRFKMKGIDYLTAKYQDWSSLWNSLVVCRFMIEGGMTLTDMLDCLKAITGWNMHLYDLAKAGERIFTLQRLVNTKYGVTRKDDTLPRRIFQPTSEGPHAGKIPKPFEQSLEDYYRLRGWDENGIPQKERIVQLNISDILEK
jgi:aldehyde:ferredoxin oxidoreductase